MTYFLMHSEPQNVVLKKQIYANELLHYFSQRRPV